MTSNPRVICVGLGRTGTSSLMSALSILGFGPCYHMSVIFKNQSVDEIRTWSGLSHGLSKLDGLRDLLQGYQSVLDYPAAMHYEELYRAFPDSKFILTTRDPTKWASSMKETILRFMDDLKPDALPEEARAFWDTFNGWHIDERLKRYHRGRLHSDTENEIIAHNTRVMNTIPTDQLLVYEVSQGWEPLTRFLGVSKPDIQFPHVNDVAEFWEAHNKL